MDFAVRRAVAAVQGAGNESERYHAANTLRELAFTDIANRDRIREAGGIPAIIAMIESSFSGWVQYIATYALYSIAYDNAENKVAIREAGGLRVLVAQAESGSSREKGIAAETLRYLSHNNDENAVAIARARGRVEAIVELARRGSMIIDANVVVQHAGAVVKRKAALVVATLFRDCVDFPIPYDIKAAIASYLLRSRTRTHWLFN